MRHEDLPHFAGWLMELAEYFPHTRAKVEVVLPEYFHALRPVAVGQLRVLLRAVLRQCRFFPTVAELLAIAQAIPTPDTCTRCPTGHGIHAGHPVRHYESGPYCERCQVPMSVPLGYSAYTPPPVQFPQIPERTDELTLSEVRDVLDTLYAVTNKRSESLTKPLTGEDSPDDGYRSRLDAAALEERRQFLCEQARDLTNGARRIPRGDTP